MQISEDHLTVADPVVLLSDRFLNLQDHLCEFPDVVGRGQHPRSGSLVLGVGNRRTFAGSSLNSNLVPMAGQLHGAGRSDGHAKLVVLDLGRNTDAHASSC